MLFELTNQYTYVTDATPAAAAALANILTYAGEDKFIMDWKTRKFRFNHAYTRHCLFEQGAFPAGLTGLVLQRLRALGHTLELHDLRARPEPYDLSLVDPELRLRYYQEEGLEALLRAGRGIAELPVGSGKSLLAIALMSAVPVNWLFVTTKNQLVDQLARDLRTKLNVHPGVIGGGHWSTGPITLATVSTLHRRRDSPEFRQLMQGIGGVIADECHRVGGDSYYELLMGCKAYYRFGLSATPGNREDDRGLRVIGALGRVVYTQTTKAMIDQGFLAKPRIVMHRLAQRFPAQNPAEAERKGVTLSVARNELIARVARGIEYPGLVFVTKKAHGERLNSLFRRDGIRSRFVWGKFSLDERKQAIADLAEGRLDIVVCTTIFQEGIDIPFLRSGIHAAGGKSAAMNVQRLGRLTRLSAGKTEFDFHDILDELPAGPGLLDSDSGNRFNENQSKVRLTSYQETVGKIDIR